VSTERLSELEAGRSQPIPPAGLLQDAQIDARRHLSFAPKNENPQRHQGLARELALPQEPTARSPGSHHAHLGIREITSESSQPVQSLRAQILGGFPRSNRSTLQVQRVMRSPLASVNVPHAIMMLSTIAQIPNPPIVTNCNRPVPILPA